MKWQEELKCNITTADQLAGYLPLSSEEIDDINHIIREYPMSIPRYYLGLIDGEDPDDPIRKLCVPAVTESMRGGSLDTSGELQNTKIEGLQHKYGQTALILSTHLCAMYCRHCFRKRLVGMNESENARRFDDIVQYIAEHEEIDNVLISGGDAFMNSNRMLEKYLQKLTAIEHVKLIRFGSRTPVVMPSRISSDQEFLDILYHYGQKVQIYVVTQFNHPRELTPEAREAIDMLLARKIIISNQTVLLNAVNDDPATLAQLMNELTHCSIVPYYLFQCRPVTGVLDQFQVPLLRSCDIVREAQAMLNGHAKRFRYIMSHVTGKIEIIGRKDDTVLFKYHQAAHEKDNGRMFAIKPSRDQCWLPDAI
ncbi:MAG: KamA family radical SAM protein [Syntrophomonadaceae bacterium]|nr:KamA family radical SAM protein [Syntrophomonadaceae bacterium]